MIIIYIVYASGLMAVAGMLYGWILLFVTSDPWRLLTDEGYLESRVAKLVEEDRSLRIFFLPLWPIGFLMDAYHMIRHHWIPDLVSSDAWYLMMHPKAWSRLRRRRRWKKRQAK